MNTELADLPDMADYDINLQAFDFSNLSPVAAAPFSTNLAFQAATRMQGQLSPPGAPEADPLQLGADLYAEDLDAAAFQDIGFEVSGEGDLVDVARPLPGLEPAPAYSPSSAPQPLAPLSPLSDRSARVSLLGLHLPHDCSLARKPQAPDREDGQHSQGVLEALDMIDMTMEDAPLPSGDHPGSQADVLDRVLTPVRDATTQPQAPAAGAEGQAVAEPDTVIARRGRHGPRLLTNDERTEVPAATVVGWRDSYTERMQERRAKRRRVYGTFSGRNPADWLVNPDNAAIHPDLQSLINHTLMPLTPVSDRGAVLSLDLDLDRPAHEDDAPAPASPLPDVIEDAGMDLAMPDVELPLVGEPARDDLSARASLQTQIFPWNAAYDSSLQVERARERQGSLSMHDTHGRLSLAETPSIRRGTVLPGSRGSVRPVPVAARLAGASILEDSEIEPFNFDPLGDDSSPPGVPERAHISPLREESEGQPRVAEFDDRSAESARARTSQQLQQLQESITPSYLQDQRHEEEIRFVE